MLNSVLWIQGESLVVAIVYNYNYINTRRLGHHSLDKRSLTCSELNMFGLEFMIPNSSCLIHMQCISILTETRERERETWKKTTWEILHFSTFYHWISPTMNSSAKELWKICSNKIWKHKKRKKRYSKSTIYSEFCLKHSFYLSALTLLSIFVIFLSYWNLSLCACAELTQPFVFYRFCSSFSFSSPSFLCCE